MTRPFLCAAFCTGLNAVCPPLLVLAYLDTDQRWKAATRNRKISAFILFYTWAAAHGHRDAAFSQRLGAFKRPRQAARQKPDEAGYHAVIATIAPEQVRDLLLFRLMGEGGLRLAELRELCGVDVTCAAGQVTLQVGARRTVHLSADLSALTLQHLSQAQIGQGLLFMARWNGGGQAVRSSWVFTLWTRYAAPLGVTVSPGYLYQFSLIREVETRPGAVCLPGLSRTTTHRYRRLAREE